MKTIIRLCIVFTVLQYTMHPVYAKLPQSITDNFPSTRIEPGQIIIHAPDIAENGAVVNVAIDRIMLGNKDLYVREIWIFDHFRKTPLAHFKLGRNTLADGLKTRFKLAGTSVLYAVALLSDGRMIGGAKTVKVTIGGCGNGGSTHSGQHYRVPGYLPPVLRPNVTHSGFVGTNNHGLTQDSERYARIDSHGIASTANQPVSTFSIDVDTGSYSNVRRFLLKQGRLPVNDAVRIEEMINYFNYQYPQPHNNDIPFTITAEVGPSPWKQGAQLLQIGLQGYRQDRSSLPAANLVFLIDVSGSMRSHDKLGLLKSSLRILTGQLSREDRIAIVVYAGASGVVLESTPGDNRQAIIAAIDSLSAGGSTNGGAGIRLAYNIARQSYIENGINRVILATDGDFNVGTTNHDTLIDMIRKQKRSGISLTTLGFGTGNYNEKLMEQLADHGDGNYAYIDSLREARKVLVSQLSGTLFTIARDVKIQVEFNPAVVAEYRLIGYENRRLRNEDFRNDRIDAGDIGAGHTVTALYEIALVGSPGLSAAPLRYQESRPAANHTNELAYIRLRYKKPAAEAGLELGQPVLTSSIQQDIHKTSDNFRFAAAVASFGQLLRHDIHIQSLDYARIVELARLATGTDEHGYRREFLELVEAANALTDSRL